MELEHKVFWAVKFLNFELKSVRERRLFQLSEFCKDAYKSTWIYEEKTKYWHNKKILKKKFELGQ